VGQRLSLARSPRGLRTRRPPRAAVAIGRCLVFQQVVKRYAIDLLCRVGEVGVNLEPLKVAHHDERRIFQVLTILERLLICDIKVPVLAFVFPAKAAALPDIRKALLALDGGSALFKRVRRAREIL